MLRREGKLFRAGVSLERGKGGSRFCCWRGVAADKHGGVNWRREVKRAHGVSCRRRSAAVGKNSELSVPSVLEDEAVERLSSWDSGAEESVRGK